MAIILNQRRAGNSTRQLDEAIQALFNQKHVTVRDHCGSNDASKLLFDRLIKRLRFEHGFDHLVEAGRILVDKGKLTLTLND